MIPQGEWGRDGKRKEQRGMSKGEGEEVSWGGELRLGWTWLETFTAYCSLLSACFFPFPHSPFPLFPFCSPLFPFSRFAFALWSPPLPQNGNLIVTLKKQCECYSALSNRGSLLNLDSSGSSGGVQS